MMNMKTFFLLKRDFITKMEVILLKRIKQIGYLLEDISGVEDKIIKASGTVKELVGLNTWEYTTYDTMGRIVHTRWEDGSNSYYEYLENKEIFYSLNTKTKRAKYQEVEVIGKSRRSIYSTGMVLRGDNLKLEFKKFLSAVR